MTLDEFFAEKLLPKQLFAIIQLELNDPADIDEEVRVWLQQAWRAAI